MTEDTVRAALPGLLPRLFRYARSLCATRADAEDLLQTTCERALSRAEQFSERGSDEASTLDRWLFTIMSSLHSNRQRQLARRGFESDLDVDQFGTSDATEWNIYLQQVLKQVESLPLAQRQVMLLVYVEGFSYQQTADMLDIPAGTVMSRIARARGKLARSQLAAAPSEKQVPIAR